MISTKEENHQQISTDESLAADQATREPSPKIMDVKTQDAPLKNQLKKEMTAHDINKRVKHIPHNSTT